MPESGKHALKAQLASEVAHIRRARPDIAITAVADGAPDNWTFLESLSPEAQAVDFWHACEHLRTASDHAVDPRWFETYRHILRHDPHGSARVIRALRYLRDRAGRNRAAIERELAFFRKHRKRMRYRDLSDRGVAIGSGPALAKAGVEAANKTLVTQRMKRSGMRWRIVGGQAVLTEPAPAKAGAPSSNPDASTAHGLVSWAMSNQRPVSASSVPGMNVETRCPRFEGQTGLKQQFCVPSVEMNGESYRRRSALDRRKRGPGRPAKIATEKNTAED